MQELQRKNSQAKLLLIWDGASYHRGQEMKKFLAQENQDLPPEDWRVTCCLFAPYSQTRKPSRRDLVTTEESTQKISSVW